MKKTHPVTLVLVGATAVGKTELSLRIAERFGGEIINADASALYRGLDIGTAKPTAEERARVRHHLIDIASPDKTVTLSEYQGLCYKHIDGILRRNMLPIVVGGSGLYVTAVIDGYTIPRVPPDHDFRDALEKEAAQSGNEALHARLQEIDPITAANTDSRNLRRVIRALEIYEIAGRAPSQLKRQAPPPYRFAILGLHRSREQLFKRIDERIELMLQQGLVEEVESLLDQGYLTSLPSMSAIGYRQIADYLQGSLSLDEAVSQMQKLTRQLARQQHNWFKNRADIHWIDAAAPDMYEESYMFTERQVML